MQFSQPEPPPRRVKYLRSVKRHHHAMQAGQRRGSARLSVEAALRIADHQDEAPIQTYSRTETLSDKVASKLLASDLLHDEALGAGASAALAVLCQREKPMLSSLAPAQACAQRVGWVLGGRSAE